MNVEYISVEMGGIYRDVEYLDSSGRGGRCTRNAPLLLNRDLDSKFFGDNMTLERFLYGEKGVLLGRDSPLRAVVLIDGKFHSKYDDREPSDEEIAQIGRTTNKIPFVYERCSSSPLDAWLDSEMRFSL